MHTLWRTEKNHCVLDKIHINELSDKEFPYKRLGKSKYQFHASKDRKYERTWPWTIVMRVIPSVFIFTSCLFFHHSHLTLHCTLHLTVRRLWSGSFSVLLCMQHRLSWGACTRTATAAATGPGPTTWPRARPASATCSNVPTHPATPTATPTASCSTSSSRQTLHG